MSAPNDREFQNVNPVRVVKEELDQNDYIIVIMGRTGAGKSTFIHAATGRDFGVGHGLESRTSQIMAIRVKRGNSYVVLVDTPGFDNDTYKSDSDILELLSGWLRDSSAHSVKLYGILYLYRTSDDRTKAMAPKNLEMFQNLCGRDRFERVIFTTTMRPDDPSDYKDAVERGKELCDEYWNIMIKGGSRATRFDGTQGSAWSILDPLVERAKQAIRIQRELKKSGPDVPDTERQEVDMRQLFAVLVEMGKTTEQDMKEVLIKEWLSQEQENAARDDERLKSWVGRKLLGIFIPKSQSKHTPAPFPYEDRCRDLISDISKNDDRYDSISTLSGGGAETMNTFLSLILKDMQRKNGHNQSRCMTYTVFCICAAKYSVEIHPPRLIPILNPNFMKYTPYSYLIDTMKPLPPTPVFDTNADEVPKTPDEVEAIDKGIETPDFY